PPEITWRKRKTGFEPPQQQWMENQALQELIIEAKRKLVRDGVLVPSVLNKKIQPHPADAAENYDWRYLVAATCITKP
ncbi:MAG TPA: hypothetical protein VKR32_14450, partial [Puia sp.]|nr:hypothetical protein [Puia sp.]